MMDPADLYDDDPGATSWAGVSCSDAVAGLRGALAAAEARAERAEAALSEARREGATHALRQAALDNEDGSLLGGSVSLRTVVGWLHARADAIERGA